MMKKIGFVVGGIVIGVLIYFVTSIYPFAKGVVEDANHKPASRSIEIKKVDDCIFDQSKQTDEFMKGMPEFSNYIWNKEDKSATIKLADGNTLIIKKGGCVHYGYYGNLISRNADINLDDDKLIQQKALWISEKIFKKSDHDFFKQALADRKYETEKNGQYLYMTFNQELWCEATIVIEKKGNGDISIEIGYYIC